jgi:glucose/arabinose dehydrogenase
MQSGCCAFITVAVFVAGSLAVAQHMVEKPLTLTGPAAYGDWRGDRPCLRRRITPADMPAPKATPSSNNSPKVVKRPDGASPMVPPGFRAELFASGLDGPRVIRVAPNGDIFVAESDGNRVKVIRAPNGVIPTETSIFASGLDNPFGIAFYPPGPNPQYVYVATPSQVVRFPYRSGDVTARGNAEIVVAALPQGGHSTRDLAFSPDGKTLFISVGSASNDAERLSDLTAAELAAFEKMHGVGAAWGEETNRADVLAYDPQGREKRTYSTGLRNCTRMAVRPETGDLWCAVNERDLLGDDLPPDFVTRVEEGQFYGWPWFYLGPNVDPRHKGQRPDLASKITVPDLLIQPHSAPLGIVFYEGSQFPPEYKGSAFVALHGSWNRAKRTGYKVVRLIFENGAPSGEYEDFLLGFVLDDNRVWGRPVDIAVAHDGSLLVTEDGNGTIWRVVYSGDTKTCT